MLMLGNRIVGVLHNENIDAILTVDVFAMSLFWAHMVANSRRALAFLVVHVFFGFGCIAFPESVFWMMNAGALCTALGLTWLWASDSLGDV